MILFEVKFTFVTICDIFVTKHHMSCNTYCCLSILFVFLKLLQKKIGAENEKFYNCKYLWKMFTIFIWVNKTHLSRTSRICGVSLTIMATCFYDSINLGSGWFSNFNWSAKISKWVLLLNTYFRYGYPKKCFSWS